MAAGAVRLFIRKSQMKFVGNITRRDGLEKVVLYSGILTRQERQRKIMYNP